MHGKFRLASLGSLLAFAPAGSASAGTTPLAPQHWIALSTTAMSITGDVTFTRTRLRFANAASLGLEPIGTLRSKVWAGTDTGNNPIRLYRVRGNGNPSLLHGNFLCPPRATYVTVVRQPGSITGSKDDIQLAVFSGAHPPAGSESDKLCGTYYAELTITRPPRHAEVGTWGRPAGYLTSRSTSRRRPPRSHRAA